MAGHVARTLATLEAGAGSSLEATGQPVAEKQALHAILKPVAEPTAPPASSLAAAQRPAQAFSSSGGAEQRSSSEQNFIFPAFKVQEAERDMLKEADSRPPSGPQAGLVADAEAGRFLLMQLKGPETVAREDGKRLLPRKVGIPSSATEGCVYEMDPFLPWVEGAPSFRGKNVALGSAEAADHFLV